MPSQSQSSPDPNTFHIIYPMQCNIFIYELMSWTDMKVFRNEKAAFRFSAIRWERENKRPQDRMACLSTGTEFRIPLPFFTNACFYGWKNHSIRCLRWMSISTRPRRDLIFLCDLAHFLMFDTEICKTASASAIEGKTSSHPLSLLTRTKHPLMFHTSWASGLCLPELSPCFP